MAPEQFVDGTHCPKKADVYSFGMLLYELATNKPPFYGKTQMVQISLALQKGKRPLIPENTPLGMKKKQQDMWWKIVKECWAQDPGVRPTMEAVANLVSNLLQLLTKKIHGFKCQTHKIGNHDYFLSYRQATEENTVLKLYDLISNSPHKSGNIKVFVDKKCLPNAEDWQKSFLYGLHHSKVIIPVISTAGLAHFEKADIENDNVLLEYEHMLSLLSLHQGKAKVFPLFVDKFPRALDYPDKPHITTNANIQNTLRGVMRLQGRVISKENLHQVIPELLEKLDELDSGANTHFTIAGGTVPTVSVPSEAEEEVFIQVEGEAQRRDFVETHLSASLLYLRSLINELKVFDFDFQFLKPSGTSGTRFALINKQQEGSKTVRDILDKEANVTLQKS